MDKAVIYARYSSSKQREASIEDQLKACREYCAQNGYEVVATYCDYAYSGRTDDRPEFQRMVQNAGESDIVLVYQHDRFSRSIYDAPRYKKMFADKGVKVMSAMEYLPEDEATAIILEKLYEGLSAAESVRTSKRVIRGMTGNAEKCMHNGVPVYGYDFTEDGHYAVNETEAEIVREIFRRKSGREAIDSIARDLARRGVVTRRGNPASFSFVDKIIKNDKYRGIYSWGNVRVVDGMPRIIDEGLFAMANGVKALKNRDNEEWDTFPLRAYGVCQCCASNLIGVSGRGRHGKKYTYYRCGKNCGVKPIRADILEREVAERIRELVANRETAIRLAQAIGDSGFDDDIETNIRLAKQRKEKAEKTLKHYRKAIGEGLPWKSIQADFERCEEEVVLAEMDLAKWEAVPRFEVEMFADFLQDVSGIDDDQLIDVMVYRIILGEENVYIVLRLREDDGDPAELILDRVRQLDTWCPIGEPERTSLAVMPSYQIVLLKFQRAA